MQFTAAQRKWIFLGFFVLIILLAAYMLRPFVSALFVGGLIAYFLYPLYQRILKKAKRPYLAQAVLSIGAAIVLLVVVAAVALPLIGQTQMIYDQTGKYVAQQIEEVRSCGQQETFKCTVANYFRADIEAYESNSVNILKRASAFLAKSLTSVLSSVGQLLLFVTIVIFSIYYFLDHGKEISQTVQNVVPLQGKHKTQIFSRLEETIKAVVGGNIAAAIMQGVAASAILFVLGIPSPLFWGLIVAVLAFIPAIGPALVWIPIAIFLLIEGSYVKATVLIVYSTIVFFWLDNYIKPKLIGDKIRLSSFAIFLAVLGGLHVFGILGLFFGPIILVLLNTCLEIYKEMKG